jgi:2,5-dihydroxypyridine 5,6-dioxygenase
MAASDRAATQLVGLARAELELCRVGRDEAVLIYADPDSRSEVTAALFGAALTLSDQVFEVTVPSVRDQRRNAMPTAIAGLAPSVDLLIDASSRGMLHGGEIAPVLAGGARILRVREPAAVLARLFPDDAVGARITQSAEILEGSEEVRFTSDDGSDLRVRREGRKVLRQYGYCGETGDWDHWGTALATFSPPENAAEGRLVLAPGDVYFYTATTGIYVEQPVTLTVEDGAIVKVEGGADARRLEAMLRSGGDPDAGCISHAGWGCDPRADWNALELYAGQGGGGADLRSYEGGVVIAFGSNLDMGGKNSTHFHMDLAFRGMSVDVDGRAVLDRGGFAIGNPG